MASNNTVQTEDIGKKRHCAYCLKVLAHIKLCGSCHRRAYCSRECQKADWKSGQCHKNWCKIEYGEEDLDWEVAPVPGKGLGLIAKRKFHTMSRIIVDAICPLTHPAVQDLMPHNGTLQDKFYFNALGSEGCGSFLCLRIARANHDCNNNASHCYDKTFNIKILVAERDIQAGEEICISYYPFTDSSQHVDTQQVRYMLQMKWGIICKNDCLCYDETIVRKVDMLREMTEEQFRLAKQCNVSSAFNLNQYTLQHYDEIHASWITKMRTYFEAFEIAVSRRCTQKQADECIRKAYEIASAIFHPKSEDCIKYENLIQNPSSHRNYLILERK